MKKVILSFFVFAVALSMTAAERSTMKMRQAAVKTLNSSKAIRTLSKSTLDVYSDGKRFSIVSRDDRFPEVLAYGSGSFDADQLPDNVKWWFDAVQRSMERAVKENAPQRAAKTYTAIGPLITTKWGQGSPYNDMCPRLSGNEQDQESPRCPSGCVATAMAQIMNYKQYPQSASFTGSCYLAKELCDERTIQSTYSWPYLTAYGLYLPTADGEAKKIDYNRNQGRSIATLLRDCGYAVNMSYNATGSGAISSDAAVAFTTKFSYPERAVKFLYRPYYTDDEWMTLLYNELANNCPILYSGASEASGGHAFVVHGIDANGLVYVNWGWQGQCDGYYAIDALTPDGDDYNDGQDMITGIRANALSTDVRQSLFATDKPYAFSYDKDNKLFKLTLNDGIYNYTTRTFTGRFCVIFESQNGGESAYMDLIEDGTEIESFSGFSAQSFPFAENKFKAGQYRVYMATLETDETEWQPVRTTGGPIYYDMTIAANGMATFGDEPVYTGIEVAKMVELPIGNASTRYFDLQGREVPASTRGLLIRKQGNDVKKVMVK